MGLVNRLCEPGEALTTARALATAIARLPQACMRSDRQSVLAQWDVDLATALRGETELGLKVIASSEMIDGIRGWRGGAWSFDDLPDV
jgi:enoyl-CoA hydratase